MTRAAATPPITTTAETIAIIKVFDTPAGSSFVGFGVELTFVDEGVAVLSGVGVTSVLVLDLVPDRLMTIINIY